MSTELPDFTVVEQTIERRLRALSLSPKRGIEQVDTGYDKFIIHRKETQVVTLGPKAASDKPTDSEPVFASLEVLAELEHPSFGSAQIADLITLEGKSPVDAMERCANTYMDVTFPALQSLFMGASAPMATRIGMASASMSGGKPVKWEVFTGQLQLLNDDDGWLTEHLDKMPPIALMLNTLTGYLGQTRLHWCKLFGHYTSNKVTFGVSIDGRKSPEAEAEMASKFGAVGKSAHPWQFRQFIVMRPTHQMDEKTAAMLRQKMAEETSTRPANSRGGWLSKLFGRRQ